MKYRLTKEIMEHEGRKLYRIEYEDGTKGGWLESESNLSEEGGCQILDEAKVFGSAKVWGNAIVRGNAMVFGFAKVYGRAWIDDSAKVCDHANVYDHATVQNEAVVHGSAKVYESATIYGKATVTDKARVYGNALISTEEVTSFDLSWSENGRVLTCKELKINPIPTASGEETIRSRQILHEKTLITLECTKI